MNITTYRIKQYNSTSKTVICVNDKPICIVAGVGKTVSNIIAYLNGYDVVISDGKIKKILDICRETENDWLSDKIIKMERFLESDKE